MRAESEFRGPVGRRQVLERYKNGQRVRRLVAALGEEVVAVLVPLLVLRRARARDHDAAVQEDDVAAAERRARRGQDRLVAEEVRVGRVAAAHAHVVAPAVAPHELREVAALAAHGLVVRVGRRRVQRLEPLSDGGLAGREVLDGARPAGVDGGVVDGVWDHGDAVLEERCRGVVARAGDDVAPGRHWLSSGKASLSNWPLAHKFAHILFEVHGAAKMPQEWDVLGTLYLAIW